MGSSAILLIHCPDRKGLVAAVADFLYQHGANVLHADQHRDNDLGLFFMRVEWDLQDFDLNRDALVTLFQPIAESFSMQWRVEYQTTRAAMAIFVSRYLHCLLDLLHRHQSGDLNCSIPLIISNHEEARPHAEFYGIAFHLIPVTAKDRPHSEEEQLRLLADHDVSLIVLARYMQVLSPSFVSRYTERIINVHHSFLPAFSGARPYHAALQRGVKLIGATSHYVTDVLDEGPIIEQDVTRVSHRDQLDDMVRKGRDLERTVLGRAVQWHLERRILCYGNKTVVFD